MEEIKKKQYFNMYINHERKKKHKKEKMKKTKKKTHFVDLEN